MANVYTGAMGMISFQTRLDVIGNNIANSKTEGFKRDDATFEVFREGMRQRITSQGKTNIGPYQDEVHIDNIYTDFSQGNIVLTDKPLDVSIKDSIVDGENTFSFFEVQHEGQNYLTRNGNLQIDSKGNLSLQNGAYVLNTAGNRVNVGTNTDVSIDSMGQVIDKKSGKVLDKIQIRTVSEENTGYLEKTNMNMYKVMTVDEIEESWGPLNTVIANFNGDLSYSRILKNVDVLNNAANTGTINIYEDEVAATLIQGALESSNVDTTEEMTDLIIAQRGIQANSKSLTVFDKINEKDANTVGARA